MKIILRQLLLAIVLMLPVAALGQNTLYVLGDFQNWAPNAGQAMTYDSAKQTFTTTITATAESGTYFKFTTQLSTSSTWDIDDYLYGATTSGDFVITESQLGQPLGLAAKGGAFKLPTGTWTLTASLAAGTLVVEGTWPGEKDGLFIAGSFTDWATGKLAMDKGSDGLYTRKVTTEAGAQFKFVDADGLWYGGVVGDITEDDIANGTPLALESPGVNLVLPVAGDWLFTVDKAAMTLTVTDQNVTPPTPAITGDVDGNGVVNGSAVTALYNLLLNGASPAGNADVDGNGVVNGSDVTTLYNILLGGGDTPEPSNVYYVGGDISMLPQYEAKGAAYRTTSGAAITSVTSFFKEQGWTALRVRLFVDPQNTDDASVIQDLAYVKSLGKRIKDEGFQFLLDFHYSDTWADPSHQTLPARWKSLSATVLADSVYAYTKNSLKELVAAGATPDMIQIGNEITYGMLWPTGHVYPAGGGNNGGSWSNFASYLKAASRACREVCPKAKIVIHTEMGNYDTNVPNFYKTLQGYNVDYDVIGISYYPAYHRALTSLESVLASLEADQPTKDIIIAETGYSYAWAMIDTKYNHTATWPYSSAGQQKFAADLIAKLKEHSHVKGVFWWWPEDNEYGVDYNNPVTPSWWNASLFDGRTGRALPAVGELQNLYK